MKRNRVADETKRQHQIEAKKLQAGEQQNWNILLQHRMYIMLLIQFKL
jgi:hypothetical protein